LVANGDDARAFLHQRLSPAPISRLSHAEAERPRNDRDNLRLGMGVWSDVVALRQLQPARKQALLAWVAVEYRRLRARRDRGGRWPPFDLLDRDDLVPSIVCPGGTRGALAVETTAIAKVFSAVFMDDPPGSDETRLSRETWA
jgi:hypothetical protein